MKNAGQNYVRLPLKHARNARELGGCPTGDGGLTKWHAFLRTDDLTALDPEEIEFLSAYGVKLVLDLRSEREADARPDPFAGTEFLYRRISLIGETIGGVKVADLTKADLERFRIEPSRFYISLLEQKEKIRELFNIIAEAPDGCVLYHCHAGKDRTGVLSMLLLGLAGVEKQDIMANYEVSFVHNTQGRCGSGKGDLPDILLSRPEFIGDAYDHLIETCGSIEAYLIETGLERETVAKVRGRIRD